MAEETSKMPPRIAKRLVLGCGALVYDLVSLIKDNEVFDQVIDIQCLPAKLHNTPQFIASEVDKYLARHSHKYAEISVAYADCGTAGALDSVLEKYRASRLEGAHCYEFFAGKQSFDEIIEDQLGSFFVTDYLVKFFDRLVIKGLGIDRYPELQEMYFKHYTQLVYLAQTDNAQLRAMAEQQARQLGLSFQYQLVGVSGLQPLVAGLLPIEVVTSPGTPRVGHSNV